MAGAGVAAVNPVYIHRSGLMSTWGYGAAAALFAGKLSLLPLKACFLHNHDCCYPQRSGGKIIPGKSLPHTNVGYGG